MHSRLALSGFLLVTGLLLMTNCSGDSTPNDAPPTGENSGGNAGVSGFGARSGQAGEESGAGSAGANTGGSSGGESGASGSTAGAGATGTTGGVGGAGGASSSGGTAGSAQGGDAGGGAFEPHPLATMWRFDKPSDRFAADYGTAKISVWSRTGSTTYAKSIQFAKASTFGVAALRAGDAVVMKLPAPGPDDALLVEHTVPANGAFASAEKVSNYTLIWDVLYPTDSDAKWRGLYNTNPVNNDDSELYVHRSNSGGIGITSEYQGSVVAETWCRIAISVTSGPIEGRIKKFINSAFVGEQIVIGERWAIGAKFLFFGDKAYEVQSVYVSALAFVGEALTEAQIEALGGVAGLGPRIGK